MYYDERCKEYIDRDKRMRIKLKIKSILMFPLWLIVYPIEALIVIAAYVIIFPFALINDLYNKFCDKDEEFFLEKFIKSWSFYFSDKIKICSQRIIK